MYIPYDKRPNFTLYTVTGITFALWSLCFNAYMPKNVLVIKNTMT